MLRNRKFFRQWDTRLHGEGGDEDDEEHGDGVFTFDDFEEMLTAAVGCEVSGTDCMTLFNEWHALIVQEKARLGYSSQRAGDEMGMLTLEKHADGFHEVLSCVEKEIAVAEEQLERRTKLGKADLRRKSSLNALAGGRVELVRKNEPVPARAEAQDKWRLAYQKLEADFFLTGFGGDDVGRAKEVEGAMGGQKWGEAAWARLLWRRGIKVAGKRV